MTKTRDAATGGVVVVHPWRHGDAAQRGLPRWPVDRLEQGTTAEAEGGVVGEDR